MDLMPEYLTKQHASIVSDLKPRMLEAAIRAGKVRAFRIGRKILIDKESLNQFIQQHEIVPNDRQAAKSELHRLLDRAIEHARKVVA